MKVTYILAILSLLSFVVLFLFHKRPRRFYVLFPLYIFPFIDLPVTPFNMGSLTVFDAMSFIAFFLLLKDFFQVNRRNRLYLAALGLLTVVLLLGSLSSDFVRTSLFNIFSIFPPFIYAKSLLQEMSLDKEFKEKVITFLKITAVYAIVFLLLQMLIGLHFTFYTQLNRNTHDPNGLRYPSFFHEPQKLQQFLAMASILCLINLKQIRKPSLVNYLAFGVMIFGMVETGGRSAFFGLFVGLLLLFFVLSYQFKINLAIISAAALIFVMTFPNFFLVLTRSKNFSDDLSYRAALWKEAYTIYSNHPALGIGLGNFKDYLMLHSTNYFITPDNEVVFPDQPESGYWKILTETGTLGFALIFLIILTPLYSKIRDYMKGKRDVLSFFFIAAILSWLISFTSVYSISDKRILIIVVILICFLIPVKNDKTTHAI